MLTEIETHGVRRREELNSPTGSPPTFKSSPLAHQGMRAAGTDQGADCLGVPGSPLPLPASGSSSFH